MPFEIAPKEVSLAEKLAALIEAGRASHPNMQHIRRKWAGPNGGCALTFAGLALGIPTPEISVSEIADRMGASFFDVELLAERVITMNDDTDASLEEIVQAVRTNKFTGGNFAQIGYFSGLVSGKAFHIDNMFVKFYGNPVLAKHGISKWIVDEISAPTVKPIPQPAKKLRVNAKTGKSWPVAKHAYA